MADKCNSSQGVKGFKMTIISFSATSSQPFGVLIWEDSFPFIRRHPSQSPHLTLRTCSPKGLHFMTTSCPKKRQLGVDSAQAELTTASRDRVEPMPQSQAEEGEKEYSVGSRGWLHTRKTQSALFAPGNCSAPDLKGLPFLEVNPVQTPRKRRAEVLRPQPCLLPFPPSRDPCHPVLVTLDLSSPSLE